jgi:hypothetical protein
MFETWAGPGCKSWGLGLIFHFSHQVGNSMYLNVLEKKHQSTIRNAIGTYPQQRIVLKKSFKWGKQLYTLMSWQKTYGNH